MCELMFLRQRLREVLPIGIRCHVVWYLLIYLSTLNMEAEHSSKNSVNFYQTTLCHIPEVSVLHI